MNFCHFPCELKIILVLAFLVWNVFLWLIWSRPSSCQSYYQWPDAHTCDKILQWKLSKFHNPKCHRQNSSRGTKSIFESLQFYNMAEGQGSLLWKWIADCIQWGRAEPLAIRTQTMALLLLVGLLEQCKIALLSCQTICTKSLPISLHICVNWILPSASSSLLMPRLFSATLKALLRLPMWSLGCSLL